MLWNITDTETLYTVYEEGPAEINLGFDTTYGTVLVFLNGLVMSTSDYDIQGNTLYITAPLAQGDVVLCRMVT